jgi:hypothetical protein
MQMLEIVVGVAFYVILALVTFFMYLCIRHPEVKYWMLLLPFFVILLYVPYECYFAIKEVSLGVPIRIDLFFILPLFEIMFVLAAYKWFLKAKKESNVFCNIMTALMIACVVAWPTYFFIYFC